MKVYVHYEPLDAPSSSYINHIVDHDTPDTLLTWFTNVHKQSTGISLDPLALELKTDYDESLKPYHMNLIDFLSVGDDIIVSSCPTRSSIPKLTNIGQNMMVSSSSNDALSSSIDGKDIKTIRKEAYDLFNSKHYRNARELINTSLSNTHAKDPILFYLLSKIYYMNENYDNAVEYAERSCHAAKSSSDISSMENTQIKLHYAKCLFAAGQYEEADVEVDKFFNTIGGFDRAVQVGGEVTSLAFEGLALHAECIFEAGHVSQAANVVNHGLSASGAEDNPALLRSYSYFALKYDKIEDALRSLLKLIAVDKDNKRSRMLFAQALRHHSTVEMIYKQVPPTTTSAPAYAFIATIAKEHSAIPAAISLYEKALSLVPNHSGYALNLIHTLELTFEYDKAIQVALKFFIKNRMMKVHHLTGKMIAEYLEDPDATSEIWNIIWMPYDNDRGYAISYPINNPPPSISSSSSSSYPEVMLEDDYDNASLEFLAIAFTIVKIFYLKGSLHRIPSLVALIEPARQASHQPLHHTLARNEHSYYSTIIQILSTRSSSSSSPPQLIYHDFSKFSTATVSNTIKAIYIVGDSHVCPLAWSMVNIHGQTRLLVPKLVTGIKHYHLRSNSDFYPKANFQHAVASCPVGSEVLFVLGEIDCREGILLAVERDRYPSIQAGMIVTCKIFATVLKQLITQRKFVPYIHPVLPMMAPTFELVMAYNNHYRSAMKDVKGAIWLDVLPLVMQDDMMSVREELKLDGTHISPSYVPLLQQALQQAVKR